MAEDQDKVSKDSVHYSKGKEESHCGNCKFFQPDANPFAAGTCKLVLGPVRWNFWCEKWRRK